MKHKLMIQRNLQPSTPPIFVPKRTDFQQWVDSGLETLPHSVEVCIRIVDKEEIQQLNHTYRKKNKPTNVLSFPFELPETIPQKTPYLGDLVLCATVINEEAFEQNKTLQAHWTHMVLHGLLHLQGYDHIQDEEASIMENLEIQLLDKLGITNPYLETSHAQET